MIETDGKGVYRRIVWTAAGIVLAFFSWRCAALHVAIAQTAPTSSQAPVSHPAMQLWRQELTSPTLPPAGRASADALAFAAREVLRQTPLNVTAIRQLALADVQLEPHRTEQLLRLAEAVSRRDIATQALLIQQAGQTNDFTEAMVHLDRLLTVKPSAVDGMAPPLASIMALREGRAALAVHADRPWFLPMLKAMVERPEIVRDIVDVIARGKVDLSQDREYLLPQLITELINRQDYATASALAFSAGKASAGQLDRFGFDAATTQQNLAPLTWQLGNEAQSVAFSPPNGIEAQLPPGRLVILAERTTRVMPGSYELVLVAETDEQGRSPLLRWELRCMGGGAERHASFALVPGKRTYRAAMTVAPACTIQKWRLFGLSDDAQLDFGVRVSSAGLVAVRR